MITIPDKITITEQDRKNAHEAHREGISAIHCCPIHQALRGHFGPKILFEVGSTQIDAYYEDGALSEFELSDEATAFVHDWDFGRIPVEGPDLEIPLT